MVVEEVTSLHGATIVRIEGSLQRDYAAGAVAYRLGRSFRHFGHNAPAQEVRVTTDGGATATNVEYCRSLVGLTTIGSGTLSARDVPIDEAVDDFPAGREVICSYVGGCVAGASPVLWGGVHYLVGETASTSVADGR